MLDWDLWHALLQVVRQGTYRGAAKVLKIDPTTIGRKIKKLERQLGYQLFVRHNGRLHPTGQCEALLPRLDQVATALRQIDVENSENEAAGLWRETKITAPPFLVSHLLAPNLKTLARDLASKVELQGTSNRQLLSRRETDMALRLEDVVDQKAIKTDLISALKIALVEYSVCVRAGSEEQALPWAGLIEGAGRDSGTEAQKELSGNEGLRYRVQQFEALSEIVASGAAKALLPNFMVKGDQRITTVSEVKLTQPLWLLYHQQDEHTVYLAKVRAWVAKCAADILL